MAEAHQRPEGALDFGRRCIRRHMQGGVVTAWVAIHRVTASVRPAGPDGAGFDRRHLVSALIDGLDGAGAPPLLLPDLLHLVLRV
jgi:hypothetical protein